MTDIYDDEYEIEEMIEDDEDYETESYIEDNEEYETESYIEDDEDEYETETVVDDYEDDEEYETESYIEDEEYKVESYTEDDEDGEYEVESYTEDSDDDDEEYEVESYEEDDEDESYDESYDDLEEKGTKGQAFLSINKSSYNITYGEVSFKDIAYSEPLKDYRKSTFKGLTQSVQDLGIVTPIHVMLTYGYSRYLSKLEDGQPDEYSSFKYVLLDGFRRLFAGVKVGLKSAKAVIWEFKDPEIGADVSVPLSLILNKVQSHDWSEVWQMQQTLEEKNIVTPNILEFLLSLDAGDAMKLKDIMLSDYEEIIEDLLSKKKTLQQSYNALQKARKEEDKLLKEDGMGISDTEEGTEITEKDDYERPRLSDNEVREILDISEDIDEQFTDDNFSEWSNENASDKWQDRANGDRIDEDLRLEILERDGYACQVSGFGKGLPRHLAKKFLNVHHVVLVSDGGLDIEDNLITISRDVHDLVHIIIDQNGKLGITKDQYEELPAEMKDFYKKVMKLVNTALRAKEKLKASGKSVKDEPYKMPKKKPCWELKKED